MFKINIKWKNWEIYMNHWVDEEATEFDTKRKVERDRVDFIARSNYWAILKSQIEKDVEQINKNLIWEEVLDEGSVKVIDTREGYEIEKTSYPNVAIQVQNKGDKVKLRICVKQNRKSQYECNDEYLEVDSRDERVFLKNDKRTFAIPEDASKYILSSIMKVLKGEL